MLRIRRIRRSDLSRVARLVRALAAAVDDPAPRLSKAALETVLFGPRAWAEGHVAVAGSTIVGYAVVSRSFEPHTAKKQLRIADLFVIESRRGAGAGRLLFRHLASRARRLGCREMVWEVWRENAAAYAFYERLGGRHAPDVTTMRFAL